MDWELNQNPYPNISRPAKNPLSMILEIKMCISGMGFTAYHIYTRSVKNLRFLRAPLFIFGILAVHFQQSSAQPKEVPLFDGETLEGWDFTKGVWRVEDGAVTAGSYEKKFPRNEFICTKRVYANFELELKIKCSGAPKTGLINSGIQIRSSRKGKRVTGYQIDCGAGWFGKIYDEHRRGLIFSKPLDAHALEKAVDTFGWNEYRILAEGPRIQVWINGVKASDYTETNPNIPLDGVIAPQIHSGGKVVVQFKDIRIRELPPTPNAPTWESLGGDKTNQEKANIRREGVQSGDKKSKDPKKIPSPPKEKGRVIFDFESGGLQGWRTVEGKMGQPIGANERLRNSRMAMNQEGKRYLGTLEQSQGGPPADFQTAVLESPVFKLEDPEVSLAVSGGTGPDTYVALCSLEGKELRKAHGKNSEFFFPHHWSVPELVGKPVFVRLVDRSKGPWGHIVVDAISAKGTLLPEFSAKRFAKLPPEAKQTKTLGPRNKANSPEEELASFTLAEGFVAELVASEAQGLINPIDLTFDDAGRLWTQTARMYPLDPVTGINFGIAMSMMRDNAAMEKDPRFAKIKRLYQLKDKGSDKILIIEDPSMEQKDPLGVFAEGLTIPQSILPYKSGVWVAHGSELFFLDDRNGDGRADEMSPVLSGFGFFDTHTMAHSLVRAPGGWIHFSHGLINSGNVMAVASGESTKIELCLTARFSLDGKVLEVVNRGLQNIWGYQLRGDGQWWGTEANDGGYSVVPMESQTTYRGVQNPKIRPYQPEFPAPHDFRVGGTGISGLAFSEDENEVGFPAEWKDVAFLANPITNAINAVKVIRNADGSIESKLLPNLLKSSDKWFRPVNLEFGPDGCLYVADWYNKIISHNEVSTAHPDRDKSHGRIWRIRHVSQKPRKAPDLIKANSEKLIRHLSSPYVLDKRAAWRQLVDRKAIDQTPALQELVADTQASKMTRIHALWTLEGLGKYNDILFEKIINGTDTDLSREAIRALSSFSLPSEKVAALVEPRLEDSNAMTRAQVLRTLAEIDQAGPAVINLLLRACKPDLPGRDLGGSYERKFERFLARKALEQYVEELRSYLKTDLAKTHLAGNLNWAIQVLPSKEKEIQFSKIWTDVSSQRIDPETYISIIGMLDKPAILKIVGQTFSDPAKGEMLLDLAIQTANRIDSSRIARFLTSTLDRMLNSSDEAQVIKALRGIHALKSQSHYPKVADMLNPSLPAGTLKEALRVLSLAPNVVNPTIYEKIATDPSVDFDIRVEALGSLIRRDANQGKRLLISISKQANLNQKKLIVGNLSVFPSGLLLLFDQWQNKNIPLDAWSLSASQQAIQSHRRDQRAIRIFEEVKKREAVIKAQVHKRIAKYTQAAKTLKGSVDAGKATFSSCLSCHKVGNSGQDIAPPLDGSAHREVEHLITAIVDPDAAVEGAYGLFRVIRKDGSITEGFLVNRNKKGTTIAMMGGAKLRIAHSEISSQAFVGGRSFMPSVYGSLPEQSMVDLIAFIKTLK